MNNSSSRLSSSLQVIGLVSYRYDKLFFNSLDFSVGSGQLLQIEGGNGTGKTTLLKILCGLIEVDEGEIFWRGNDIRSVMDEYKRDLNYLGHKNGIKAGLTCLENLKVLSALGYRVITTDYSYVLERYGLKGCDDTYAYKLSAGQKRRLSLAKLSICEASIWILDEPFTSLDEKGKEDMKTIFSQHLISGGTILVTSHEEIIWRGMDVSTVRL